jgi:drug/metabolite transporter (DMT)-like permease
MLNKILNFGPFFIIIAALLWSLDGVLRIGLYLLPPAIVVFYEHFFGAVILLFLFAFWIKDVVKMNKKQWLGISLVSLFSGALGTILYTAALGLINYSQYSVVVVLQQLQPIWAISASAILLKEKITRKFLVWAGMALIAAYFVTFKDLTVNLSTGKGTLYAGIFALLAGFMWGSSTAVSKYVLNEISFLSVAALRFFMAPVFALAIIGLQGNIDKLLILNKAQIISLIAITLSTGLVALIIYYYGLKKTPARVSSICELVWPASAVFIDFYFFHKDFTITQVLGIIVLLFSIRKITQFKT